MTLQKIKRITNSHFGYIKKCISVQIGMPRFILISEFINNVIVGK